MSGYSPGPWRYQPNGKNRYNVVHDWQRGGVGESLAQQILRAHDAALISAAPDLAEALKTMTLIVDTKFAELCPFEEPAKTMFIDMCKKARAALAKAGVA